MHTQIYPLYFSFIHSLLPVIWLTGRCCWEVKRGKGPQGAAKKVIGSVIVPAAWGLRSSQGAEGEATTQLPVLCITSIPHTFCPLPLTKDPVSEQYIPCTNYYSLAFWNIVIQNEGASWWNNHIIMFSTLLSLVLYWCCFWITFTG